MGAGLSTEVLLALLDVAEVGVSGAEVQARLKAQGQEPRADKLMVALLRLEDTGHVAIARGDGMRFALTEKGRDRAYELGGGKPVHLQLLMADLVSFTEFTSTHGDIAARAAAGTLHQVASDAFRRDGGQVVKSMGDGFLAWLPPNADPMPVLAKVSAGCSQPSGDRWPLHAASHIGHPIQHGGDLFGRDVNLVARLCDAAAPGELVRSAGGHGDPEHLTVRGFEGSIPVWRVGDPVTRLFGRGELKLALLHVAADLGPTNGYSIMHGLADRVGGTWNPSPGAISPALLALEDAGLLEGRDDDGTRRYEITAAGRRQVAADPDVIDDVAVRARRAPAPPVTVGAVLDRLAADAPRRDSALRPHQIRRIEALFKPLLSELRDLTAEEAP